MVNVPFGVYVHVPFCTSRCDYCAFATWTDRFGLVDEYVEACRRQLQVSHLEGDHPDGVTSVFFGGGTPSLLQPEQLGRILSAVPLAEGAEVTVECNPETVTATKLAGYRSAGVNRLSFGVQSLVDHVLVGLGRHHDRADVARAVDAAGQAGFAEHFSLDLIFGGAGESLADWTNTLESALSLEPAPLHVSAYALTVEPGTPLALDAARHPDPDDQADKYLAADDILAGAGLEWYEISNWAKPDRECRHNQLYWQQGEYLGVGCAAHSHRVNADGTSRRWWNLRTPERYVAAVASGASPEAAGEDLDFAVRSFEGLELLLRTRRGVPAPSLPSWPADPDLEGLLVAAPGGRLVLTRQGRLLANEVATRLDATMPPEGTVEGGSK